MNSKSKGKIKDSSDEDDEWLFDTILGFLSSQIWSIPVQHFLETNCSIFSPNDTWSGGALMDDDSDENLEKVPTEYIDMHLKYKDLVDTLISTFLHDIGVSYNQFLRASKRSNSLNENSAYLELFEQIWSAENFRMFKSLMVRKNIELELQALVLLQYQLGIIKSGNGEAKNDDEDEIMQLVIKKSADEYDSLMKSRGKGKSSAQNDREQQDYETAKKLAKQKELVEALSDELDQQEYLNRKILKENLKNPTIDRPVSARKNQVEDQFRHMNIEERKSDDKSKLVHDIAQTVLEKSGGNLSQSEIERRAEFMRKQRDILTEKKRVERQKQIDELVKESRRTGDRPMSSRAARSVLSGADPTEINHSSSSDEERKKIEARKALAETLRKEVINRKN